MNNLDNEFNKRFQHKASNTDDLNVNDMWDFIESELDEDSDRAAFIYFPIWLGISFIAMLLFGTLFWINLDNDQDISKQNSKDTFVHCIEPTSVLNGELVGDDNKQINETSLQPKETKKTTFVAITEQKKPLKQIINSSTLTSTGLYKPMIPATKLVDLKSAGSTFDEPNMIVNTKEENETYPRISVQGSSIRSTIKAFEKVSDRYIISKPVLKIDSENDGDLSFSFPIPSLLPLRKKENTPPKSTIVDIVLGLRAGVNWNDLNYRNPENQVYQSVRTNSETGDFGQSYGLDITMILKKRWAIRTGIEFHEFWTIFDYKNVETTQLTEKNQLIKVWLNGNDTLNTEYGSVQLTNTSSRVVLHHNKYQQISIPLQIGLRNNFKKLVYGINLGTSFNFQLYQSGRFLNQDQEVTDYNQNIGLAPLKGFNIGLSISPMLGYSLTKKTALQLRPNFNFQTHSDFANESHSILVNQINLTLGMEYQF